MKATPHRLAQNPTRDEPMVEQGVVNGWTISWNPDDDMFYVEAGETVRRFNVLRNAVQFARAREVR